MTMKSRAYRLAIPTAVLLVAVLLAGCATSSGGSAATARGQAMANANDLPEWYLNPQSVYPNEVFLTAVGTGDTRRDAEQQALAGLSQIFEAQVQVDARTSERYSEIMSAQGTVSENEVRLAQNTNVRSNQTLLNVQFGEAAVDETARVHVIAYIERIPTGRVYMDLIETNGDQVERFLDEASRSNGMVREYSYVSAAAVVASANRVLQDQLRIIAPGFSEIATVPYDYDDVLQRRADLAAEMRVSVAIDGDPEGRISGILRQALSEERFPVGDDDPVLRITGRAALTDGEVNDDFLSVRWNLTLDMIGPNGNTLVTFDDQGRASGVSREAAVAFAHRDMEEAVADGFVASVGRYFDGVVLGN
jgi:predicted small secreted protein